MNFDVKAMMHAYRCDERGTKCSGIKCCYDEAECRKKVYATALQWNCKNANGQNEDYLSVRDRVRLVLNVNSEFNTNEKFVLRSP